MEDSLKGGGGCRGPGVLIAWLEEVAALRYNKVRYCKLGSNKLMHVKSRYNKAM